MNIEPLCNVPLFRGIPASEIQILSSALQERRYKKNEFIFYRGDEGSSLFIVGFGIVKIAVTSAGGREKTLAILGKGDFFGELSLFDGSPRSADAMANEETFLYSLGRQKFVSFLNSHPNASLMILKVLSYRLRRTDDLLQDVTFLDVPARLLKAIIELAKNEGKPGEGVTPNMNQTDLAALIGATRESVNKWLRFYQREGLLKFEKAQITVPNMNKLHQYVSQKIY